MLPDPPFIIIRHHPRKTTLIMRRLMVIGAPFLEVIFADYLPTNRPLHFNIIPEIKIATATTKKRLPILPPKEDIMEEKEPE